jgi:acetyl esterase/lipase
MTFHPELRGRARLLRAIPQAVFFAARPARRRERFAIQWAARRLRDFSEHVLGPGTSVWAHRPRHPVAGRAVLWIHGGGYRTGSAVFDAALLRAYADETRALVVAVDYRLAPEHPFPAPLDDCQAAYRWLVDQEGVDPALVVIAGASAGGGLAAALVQSLRDQGAVRAAGQVLGYPMLDDRTALRRDLDGAHLIWPNDVNRVAWQEYTGHEPGSAAVPPYAVPGRTEDLAGLPPAWIGVGTADLFCAEDVGYAARLADAGVEVQVEVVTGAFHGFDIMKPDAEVSRAFVAAQTRAASGFLDAAEAARGSEPQKKSDPPSALTVAPVT